MRISDWSSDVCSSDLIGEAYRRLGAVSDKRRATGARTPRQAEAVSLIREAIEMDATDIHINVKRDGCTVELRVDGLKQAHTRWTVEQGYEFCRADRKRPRLNSSH